VAVGRGGVHAVQEHDVQVRVDRWRAVSPLARWGTEAESVSVRACAWTRTPIAREVEKVPEEKKDAFRDEFYDDLASSNVLCAGWF